MKNLVLIIIGLCGFMTLSAQSDFLQSGQNAIGLGIGYDLLEEQGSIYAQGSYTINGKWDINLRYTTFGESVFGDGTINLFSFGTHYLFLKQSESTPLNLGGGISYGIFDFGGDELQNLGIDLSSSQLNVFATLSRGLNMNGAVRFFPRVKAGLLRTSISVTDGTEKASESESGFVGTAGISVAFNAGKNLIVLDPQVLFGDGASGFGLGLSYFFVK